MWPFGRVKSESEKTVIKEFPNNVFIVCVGSKYLDRDGVSFWREFGHAKDWASFATLEEAKKHYEQYLEIPPEGKVVYP